jgi:hypothetical protein
MWRCESSVILIYLDYKEFSAALRLKFTAYDVTKKITKPVHITGLIKKDIFLSGNRSPQQE